MFLVRRNPWAVVWWSVALPGFGHLRLGQCLTGLFLMSWEILLNHLAHLNQAIFYTMTGQFELAKSVIDYRWALLYPLVYIFSLCDAYRVCLRLNRLADLERTQRKRQFQLVALTCLGIAAIDRRSPWVSAFWSGMISGLGQLYCERMLKALFLMIWYLIVITLSGLAQSVYFLWMGDSARSFAALDFQWLLFCPSIWVFGVVDAYSEAVEQNSVMDMAFHYRMRHHLQNGTGQGYSPVRP